MNGSWNFADSIGFTRGVAEAGQETFKGNVLASLTREICQNSLDASANNQPVTVKFRKEQIPVNQIPGYLTLRKIFKESITYSQEKDRRKEVEFFTRGLNILNQNLIPVLRISDFNTTGLTGSHSDKATAWSSMVKSEGISSKSGNKGGSFGICKSSIYATSNLNCLFFNTFDQDDTHACEGTISLPEAMLDGKERFGIGYYGISEDASNANIKCCEHVPEIDKLYHRTEHGTDIFVIGFNDYEDWSRQIIDALLDNFLIALYDNKLLVHVQNEIVDKEHLDDLFKKYRERNEDSSSYQYYQVLTSEKTTSIKPITDLYDDLNGTINLDVLLFNDANACRTVLITRSNGMKLFDMNRISSSLQFAAICKINGHDLNSFFSSIESPAHNEWTPERLEEKNKVSKAKKRVAAFKRRIKKEILALDTYKDADEADIEGLGDILPDAEFYDMSDEHHKTPESLSNGIKKIERKKRAKSFETTDFKTENNADTLYEVDDFGTLDESGDFATTNYPHSAPNNTDGGIGSPASANDTFGDRPIKTFRNVNRFKKRIFVSNADNSEYTLIISTNRDLQDCRIEVNLSGESSKISCTITSTTLITTGQELKTMGNKIILPSLKKHFSYKIRFRIDSPYLCSLEVKLYANR